MDIHKINSALKLVLAEIQKYEESQPQRKKPINESKSARTAKYQVMFHSKSQQQ